MYHTKFSFNACESSSLSVCRLRRSDSRPKTTTNAADFSSVPQVPLACDRGKTMPLLENKFLEHHLVIPKIVMSSCTKSDDEEDERRPRRPEIRCSPAPCVFDAPRTPHRTPSPESPVLRRRWSSPRRSPDSRRGSELAPGYEQYRKMLLEVPAALEYGDASSDDLSSEWDSDVPDAPVPEQAKVRWMVMLIMTGVMPWGIIR